MLIGATDTSSVDFANIFKEGLGRGSIKVIGATTTEEYERYILRDKAFTRRFQKILVPEPTREETIEIMMGTLPKIEKTTGAKLKYTNFIKEKIMAFLVDLTSEYKRIFEIGSRYPDISLTLLKQAFSYAMFDNSKEVNIFHIQKAIENSKNVYPDVIKKEIPRFLEEFKDIINEEKGLSLKWDYNKQESQSTEENEEIEELDVDYDSVQDTAPNLYNETIIRDNNLVPQRENHESIDKNLISSNLYNSLNSKNEECDLSLNENTDNYNDDFFEE